jgi:hypothetical protein
MNIKLPADLGMQAMTRIMVIIQQASRHTDGTLTDAGSRFIRDTITAEFGKDMMDSITAGETIELDHKRDPKTDAS